MIYASIAKAEVVGFHDAVARALERNPNARIAAEEIVRARAVVAEVRAASLPTLTLNGGYSRLDGGNPGVGANLLSSNLNVTVPLVAPRAWAAWRHAKDNVEVQRLSAAEVRRELAATVARTYLSILAQRRVVDATERARATAEAHYQFAHQRFAGGYGNRVDEVRAAGEVAADAAQVESAQALLTRLRESLGVLVGVDRPLDVAEEVDLGGGNQPSEIEARADLRLLHGRVDYASRVRRDSWTEYLPSIGLSLQPFYDSVPTALLPQYGWQAQLALTWPLYDGGFRYGLIRERRSLETEARLQLENAQRQAGSEVRTADEEVRRSAASLDSARQAARLAAQALELTNIGYRAGASTNIEVIDAERRARDADTAVAQAEDAWRQSLLDLLLATGRFPT